MANYTESERLAGLRVAILITDGFEQVEMTEPRKKLNNNGAETKIVSPRRGHASGRGTSRTGARTSTSTSACTMPSPTSSTRCTCPAA